MAAGAACDDSAMLTERQVQDIARRVAAAARSPAKVIVFGSYGRDDADEDSDLDLMVIEREVQDPTAEYVRLREAVGPVDVGVDLILLPEDEFERRRDWASSPVYWAVREGRLVHDAAGAA
jgi:predicted nucleotidyltransferase